jgi:hypothetical protein
MIYGFFAGGRFLPNEVNPGLEAVMKTEGIYDHIQLEVRNEDGEIRDFRKDEIIIIHEDNRDQYSEYLI